MFDTSVDPKREVERLYKFMGVPSEGAAINVNKAAYELMSGAAQDKTKGRAPNVLNKASYQPMLNETRERLEDFFHPYNQEMCSLLEIYPCLRVPLFEQFCM